MTQGTTSREQPGLLRILGADFPAFLAALSPAVGIALALLLALFGQIPQLGTHAGLAREDLPLLLALVAAVVAVTLPLLSLRLRHLRRLFAHAEQVPGRLLRATRATNGSRFRFSYRLAGQRHERNLWTPTWFDLENGQRITVLVDPKHPRQGLIRELYLY